MTVLLSLPGNRVRPKAGPVVNLTRQSIHLAKKMDARIKSAHDGGEV
jgi:hypothetical protein